MAIGVGSIYAWLLRRMSCPKHEPRQIAYYAHNVHEFRVRRYRPIEYIGGEWTECRDE